VAPADAVHGAARPGAPAAAPSRRAAARSARSPPPRRSRIKFFAKIKALLVLAPKLKLLTTSGSMLLSVGAYTLLWGWRFAVGFVALLFVHEMGHYIQLRREGITPSGMVFIPFLGAAVASRSLGGSAVAEARVGLAGPILGSARVCAAAAARRRPRVLARARLHGLLHQPDQPRPRGPVRRRSARWRRWRRGCGSSASG
jgi:hypothetical protein